MHPKVHSITLGNSELSSANTAKEVEALRQRIQDDLQRVFDIPTAANAMCLVDNSASARQAAADSLATLIGRGLVSCSIDVSYTVEGYSLQYDRQKHRWIITTNGTGCYGERIERSYLSARSRRLAHRAGKREHHRVYLEASFIPEVPAEHVTFDINFTEQDNAAE